MGKKSYPSAKDKRSARDTMRKINLAVAAGGHARHPANTITRIGTGTTSSNASIHLAQERQAVYDRICESLRTFYTTSRAGWLSQFWHSTFSKIHLAFPSSDADLHDSRQQLVQIFARAVEEHCEKTLQELQRLRNAAITEYVEDYITKTMNFIVFTDQKVQALILLNNLVFMPVTSVTLQGFACRIYHGIVTQSFQSIADSPQWKNLVYKEVNLMDVTSNKTMVDFLGALENAENQLWRACGNDIAEVSCPSYFKDFAKSFLSAFTNCAKAYIQVESKDVRMSGLQSKDCYEMYTDWYNRFREILEYGMGFVKYIQSVSFQSSPDITNEMIAEVMLNADPYMLAETIAFFSTTTNIMVTPVLENLSDSPGGSNATPYDSNGIQIMLWFRKWIPQYISDMGEKLELLTQIQEAMTRLIFLSPLTKMAWVDRISVHYDSNASLKELFPEIGGTKWSQLAADSLSKQTSIKNIIIHLINELVGGGLFNQKLQWDQGRIQNLPLHLEQLTSGHDRIFLLSFLEVTLPQYLGGRFDQTNQSEDCLINPILNLSTMYREEIPMDALINMVRQVASNRLLGRNDPVLLGLGTWLCTEDPSLSVDIPNELESWVSPEKILAKMNSMIDDAEYSIKWSPAWSNVTVEYLGHVFTCSVLQYRVISTLLKSTIPLSHEALLPEFDGEFQKGFMMDLVETSKGFVRFSEDPPLYALDLNQLPQGTSLLKVRPTDV